MFERGDLVLVPYPFSDLSVTKRRPVLLLNMWNRFDGFRRSRSMRQGWKRTAVITALTATLSAIAGSNFLTTLGNAEDLVPLAVIAFPSPRKRPIRLPTE